MKQKLHLLKLCSLFAVMAPATQSMAMSARNALKSDVIKTPLVKYGSFSVNKNDAFAKITGVVKDASGELLPGVTIVVKGTTRAVQTNVDGKFSIDGSVGEVLVISYIGYITQEIIVSNQTTLNIVLVSNTKNLQDVVVTALGIKRESKTLTYGVQTFKSSDVNAVKDPSLVNTLSGKIAGAQITRSSSGLGGSTKIVLRGSKSVTGDNNALFVIDGIPMPRNNSSQIASAFGGQDRGDAVENLNSEDVESITVLPGSAASALYGNQGSNGVILITTKKGIAGKTLVNFSSNTTFENEFKLPEMQNTYGQSDVAANANDSWANTKLSSPSSFNPKNFFNTGKTFTNSLSIQTGTKTNQTYFGFESTNATGIIPNNKLNKYNFNVRNSSQFFNDKLTLDITANYISQNVNNRPNQGFYYNPIVPLYIFPRGVDFNQYKNYQVYDPSRNLMVQNWPSAFTVSDIATQNPYWIVNRNNNQEKLSRIMGTVSAKYLFSDWFNIQARVKIDRTSDTYEAQNFASSNTTIVGTKGSYTYNPTSVTQTYADVIANFNKKINEFSLTANLGASLQNNLNAGANTSGNLLNFANVFSISNIDYSRVYPSQYSDRSQTQSLFGTATIGFKDEFFLDLTARNDWDSSLAFTSKNNYFYPSVGINAILSQIFKLPEFISFAKIRGNVTGVGNGASSILYATNPTYAVTNGTVSAIGAEGLATLKPENTRSYEIGTDLRFFNNSLTLSANIYRSFTTNQIYAIQPSASSLHSLYYFNGGNVRNEGIEGTLGYQLKSGDFSWTPSINFSLNRNKVLTVLDNFTEPSTGQKKSLDYVTLSTDFFDLRVQKGGSYGDMYSRTLQKDASGNYIVDTDGIPLRSNDLSKIGNYNARFLAGFQNQFDYKNFSLSFLIDGHFGGQVVSLTNSVLDFYGTSAATAKARDNGGVQINNQKVDAKKYYDLIDGRNGLASEYVYSATNIRLREVALGYTLPGTLFNNKIKRIGISVLARNLFFLKNNAPFDPDAALSTGNGFQGIDIFNLPTIRSVGFKVSAQF